MHLARAFDRAPSGWDVSLHDCLVDAADVVVAGPDQDIPGAIVFDPLRPDKLIEEIRTVAGAVSGRVIAVTSGVPGAGATTVALHLAAIAQGCAVEIGERGFRTRLAMHSARSCSPATEDESLEMRALPVAPGFRVLIDAAPENARDLIGRCRERFETTIVDAPLDTILDLGKMTAVVVVFPPTRGAAERTAAALHNATQQRPALVTNRLGPGSCTSRAEIERILERKLAIELPCSAAIRDTEDKGELVTTPLSPWLWKLRALWRTLAAI